ncbi:co-chaperone GroES [Candidatus Azambacteria bacterium]|nr:co-chaperone GroES [Candidatus Azambacteria bacterium]
MKLNPISDNIIISPEKQETKTKGGILLPESVEKEKPQIGDVIAVGPGRLLENGERAKTQVKKGDKVLFSRYSPQEIKVDGKEYFVLKEDDILAIIN